MRLRDKVAIVTGAGRGIGRAIALALAKEGADVVTVARSDEIYDVAKEIEGLGRRSLAIKCNVSKWNDVQNVVKRTLETFERIDILINNAGISHVALIENITPDDWDRVMGVNAKGPFLFCKAVLPHMKKQRYGKIVNTASAAGLQGFAGLSSYSMSKFAVVGLTQALAKEVGEYNINANAVCPGVVHTKMWDYMASQPEVVYLFPATKGKTHLPAKEIVEGICKGSMALKRPQTPEDIANMVVFLCSEEAKNITGQAMSVDGGQTFH